MTILPDTADRVVVDHTRCTPDVHDRTAEGTEEQRLDDEGLLACNHCGRGIYYCANDEEHHHLDNPETGCFLIPAEIHAATTPGPTSVVSHAMWASARVLDAAGPLTPSEDDVTRWQQRMDRDPANVLAAVVESTLPILLRDLAATAGTRLGDELTGLTAALLAFERTDPAWNPTPPAAPSSPCPSSSGCPR